MRLEYLDPPIRTSDRVLSRTVVVPIHRRRGLADVENQPRRSGRHDDHEADQHESGFHAEQHHQHASDDSDQGRDNDPASGVVLQLRLFSTAAFGSKPLRLDHVAAPTVEPPSA